MKKKKYKKAIYKTLTWRLVSSGSSFLIIYLGTGDLHLAGGIAAVDAVVKTVLYYYHELLWQDKSKYLYKNQQDNNESE